MSVAELLESMSDAQLQAGIKANRAILASRSMPSTRKALAREVLTALQTEAGRRCAHEFTKRHYH